MTREEAIEYLTILGGIGGITDNEAMALEIAIEALEQKSKKGHWIKEKTIYGWDGCSYQCSECGRSVHLDTAVEDINLDYPYCHCGAKMESEVEE